ncbi:presqualene diphosphate synthase HpnD [Azospirillum halopraeferens]|uniref:presqualene diphosphate synthase HpnD n=1 Tax=Azospirillum halopraeferens TaxID=34010 RepID=UPI00040EA12E|nr:presqualene diphosphate synthase HpnD [Azospirillum halopraeferens]
MTAPLPAAAARRLAESPARVAGRSGSTFYWPMLLLPRSKRAAMFAIYAFCRQVDDVADEPGDPEAKRRALAAWRGTIRSLYAGAAPTDGLTAALKGAIERYGLPRAELEAVVDGMAMDLAGLMRGPDEATLALYCRRVAGAVGLLAVRVFDRADPESEAFALALGEALQLTNILRDLAEDAGLGRLYLPAELLDAAGITARDPAAVLAHPALPGVCAALAARAEARFVEAEHRMARCRRANLWAAEAMMVLYRRLLAALVARGWHDPGQRVRLRKRACAWVALRCMAGWPPAR